MEKKTARITPIHRKGRRDNCENYRGLSVTNIISRIYENIVEGKIEGDYKDVEAEEQPWLDQP